MSNEDCVEYASRCDKAGKRHWRQPKPLLSRVKDVGRVEEGKERGRTKSERVSVVCDCVWVQENRMIGIGEIERRERRGQQGTRYGILRPPWVPFYLYTCKRVNAQHGARVHAYVLYHDRLPTLPTISDRCR